MGVKSHDFPLSPNSKASITNIIVPIIPNITSDSGILLKGFRTGKTNDAKNTAEKLMEIWDSVLYL